jgi:hypothetical protein
MRRIALAAAVLALGGALVASVGAGTQLAAKKIVGTARADVLKGTSKADVINGKGGNDKLYGLAGSDTLIGGPGNDTLVGGPGKDKYSCGPGKDTVVADASDVKPGKDCEAVTGLPKPAISVEDATGAEGNSGTTTLSFAVTLSAASGQPVSVSFATADGTATAPADYQSLSGKVTFAPGQKSKTVNVSVVGETTVEQDETFTVALSNPVNATVANGSATGTIKNDDVAPRSGHYAGTTSQGRPIGFDVAPDLKSLSNLIVYVDLTCTEVPLILPNNQLDLTGASFPMAPDWSFNVNLPYSDPEGSINLALNGKLSVPGSASGTMRIDFAVNNVPGVGTVHCSTGDMTWSASAT